MGLMYHSHSAASFLRLAKHVQGVRPDGSTFKRTHKKWQQASFIHIVFKSSIKYNQAIMPKRIWERKSAVFNVKQLFQHFYAKPRKIKAEKLNVICFLLRQWTNKEKIGMCTAFLPPDVGSLSDTMLTHTYITARQYVENRTERKSKETHETNEIFDKQLWYYKQ